MASTSLSSKCALHMAPQTGTSLSCITVFSARFLSPGVNVLRRGRRSRVNRVFRPRAIRCEERAKYLRRDLPSRVNAARMRVRRGCATSCATVCDPLSFIVRRARVSRRSGLVLKSENGRCDVVRIPASQTGRFASPCGEQEKCYRVRASCMHGGTGVRTCCVARGQSTA